MPTTPKGLPSPAATPDDNNNHDAIKALADRLDLMIAQGRTAAQITALAGVDLWTGRRQRQSDGTGTAKRQQTGLYLYDGATWQPGIGDGGGGTGPTPVLTAATTNPNMGTTGTSTWEWWMLGDWCVGQMIFTWGGTGVTPGTGELQIPLPVANAAFAAPSAARVVPLGAGVLRDASAAAAAQTFDVALVNTGASSSIARLSYYGVTTNNAASGSVPIQLGAAGDTIKVDFAYLT
jgi:hypothetical protein